MLIKVDLPINKTVAELILHPSLYIFLNKLNTWHILGKAWMCSDSSIIYKNTERCVVFNQYNKRLVSVNQKNIVYVPSDLKGLTIYRRIDTFKQNNFTAYSKIITAVTNIYNIINHTTGDIYGIGGEFYIYFLLFKDRYIKFTGFSNSNDIIAVAEKNLLNYLRTDKVHLKIVDYNDLIFKIDNLVSDLIINLSKIPIKLLQSINNSRFSNIIIITCNQNNFNKRRYIIESNYRLRKFTHISLNTTVVISIFFYIPKNNVFKLN